MYHNQILKYSSLSLCIKSPSISNTES